ncbi:hypothetical protein C8A05DRAFT_15898, partial [Staphylotrichum tortipilum]
MATAQTPSLLAIPVEIQLAICAQIVESFRRDGHGAPPIPARPDPTPTWRKDTLENFAALGGLARTCKTLEQLTAPMLFERVEVSIFRPTTFVQIIRHFSRFGHIAAYVRHLTIGSAWDASTLSASQASFLLQEGQRLGLSLLPDRLPDLVSDPVESKSMLIDVLLCQVPAVRKLVLSLSQHLYLCEGSASSVLSYPAWRPGSIPSVLSYAARLPDSFALGSLR